MSAFRNRVGGARSRRLRSSRRVAPLAGLAAIGVAAASPWASTAANAYVHTARLHHVHLAVRRAAPLPASTGESLPDDRGASDHALPAVTPGPILPLSLRHLSPNQLTAEQAQASLMADQDPIWQLACRRIAERDRTLVAVDPAAAEGLPDATNALSLNPLLAAEGCDRGARVLLHVRLPAGRKEIALTFDDGPHPLFTPRLLDILRNLHVPATFFVVGRMAERAPDLVREEMADGFDVENHTYHHVSLTKLPTEEALDEIEACGMVVQDITGRAPHLFRPPGGRFTAAVASEAASMGYTTVLWTDDPGDYTNPPEQVILQRALRSARNGGILLLHDGIPGTMDVLPVLVADLRAQGYTFVNARELAHQAFSAKPRRDARALQPVYASSPAVVDVAGETPAVE